MSRIKPSVARLLMGVGISLALGWGAGTARAAITSMSPSNGSPLTDASQLFLWTGAANTTEYWLYVGSTLGTNDIHDSGSLGTSTSTTVSGLPTNGNMLYVRLWQFEGENWVHTDFTYTAFTDANGGGLGAVPVSDGLSAVPVSSGLNAVPASDGLSAIPVSSGLNAVPVWDQVLPAPMRFVLVMGGTAVLDKETGLVWEQSPQTTTHAWSDARLECTSRAVTGRKGWRLPSVNELASLFDTMNTNPTLPNGHPFSNVLPSRYWSATTSADFPTLAWDGHLGNGEVARNLKASFLFVWCVRGGGLLSEY